MDRGFFLDELYPFQDDVLRVIGDAETGFYLTGGTAASRGYLNHRFSDDLDLFVNDDERFSLWSDRIVHALRSPGWEITVLRRDERFVRCTVARPGNVPMKIEMVNDVPSRVGVVRDDPVLGRVDTAENILANKVTAIIDREEPKDLADVWGFCTRKGLSLTEALENAASKAAGLFAPDLARVLCSATRPSWEVVRWIEAPPAERYLAELEALGESLILTTGE